MSSTPPSDDHVTTYRLLLLATLHAFLFDLCQISYDGTHTDDIYTVSMRNFVLNLFVDIEIQILSSTKLTCS
jgi:hypothetical protein